MPCSSHNRRPRTASLQHIDWIMFRSPTNRDAFKTNNSFTCPTASRHTNGSRHMRFFLRLECFMVHNCILTAPPPPSLNQTNGYFQCVPYYSTYISGQTRGVREKRKLPGFDKRQQTPPSFEVREELHLQHTHDDVSRKHYEIHHAVHLSEFSTKHREQTLETVVPRLFEPIGWHT